MALLNQIIFLQQLKDELIEKAKDPNVTYSQTLEIYKELRKINIKIQEMRQ
ncbi:hypothetical protein [Aneurinibacillus migulanus]|jgi:ABC-type Zn uptake system ZnuABC Zn-binding protein ZnuA|uniref:Uncharacterized protein n=1 Tax=Aneurinibacillus migulanus TaxID=47500 RepID=A0A1G8U7J0_ANEMI|nr:hypothetical protein [Aneurinibacillus migulanus]MCP1358358.1 hypothetical protein [Aneurinibacillus migulanus]MED0895567.1 hypothetical protein [Aneurinibacillus migulanus]MED1617967.1 hypothetical protein [Aneurinibacillus migulanus]MED4727740.1 hypothetical protein [Aneurinibacillus migulanus]SDJ49689.1 hypothetical protein SAMN04487909_11929 [Aneurinibacillus migulanus]